MSAPSVLLVGAGKMGGALLSGWLSGAGASGPAQFSVIDPQPGETLDRFAGEGRITLNPDVTRLKPMPPTVTVLAVKPQIMSEAIAPLKPLAEAGGVFVSVAAGTTIAGIRSVLGAETPVIRAMPNTPASVGRGITVCTASSNVGEESKALCSDLLSAVGRVAWLDDEAQMDAVTAVSGSGPAYVFYLTECLTKAGIKAGLPPALAEEMARTTVAGAGEMLWQREDSAEALRVQVTSPGGTTQAALDVLMAEPGLESLMKDAVAAATARGRELGEE